MKPNVDIDHPLGHHNAGGLVPDVPVKEISTEFKNTIRQN